MLLIRIFIRSYLFSGTLNLQISTAYAVKNGVMAEISEFFTIYLVTKYVTVENSELFNAFYRVDVS